VAAATSRRISPRPYVTAVFPAGRRCLDNIRRSANPRSPAGQQRSATLPREAMDLPEALSAVWARIQQRRHPLRCARNHHPNTDPRAAPLDFSTRGRTLHGIDAPPQRSGDACVYARRAGRAVRRRLFGALYEAAIERVSATSRPVHSHATRMLAARTRSLSAGFSDDGLRAGWRPSRSSLLVAVHVSSRR